MKNEIVFCVTRSYLEKDLTPTDITGLYTIKNPDFARTSHFMSRAIVDSNEYIEVAKQVPQLLPYIIIKDKDKILTYSRDKGTEQRLHGSLSLGFGGHISLEDMLPFEGSFIINAMRRELQEELAIPLSAITLETIKKLINDKSNEVGQVHVGLLCIANLKPSIKVNPNPDEIHNPKWLSLEEITQDKANYESWSQIAIDYLNQ